MHIVKDRSTGYQNNSGVHLSYQCCYFQLMRYAQFATLMPPANSPEQPSEILLISPELIIEWVTSLTCWPNIAHFSRSGHQEYKTHPEWYSFLTSWVDPCFCLFMYQNTCHLFMTYFRDHFDQDSKTIAENWGNWTVLWPIQS